MSLLQTTPVTIPPSSFAVPPPVSGAPAVNAIRGVQTGTRHGHQDVPVEDVVLEQAGVVE